LAVDEAGIRLRPATRDDLPLLKRLYRATRMPEMLLAPMTLAEKQGFADDQFRLQHSHFVRHFARADFWMILREDMPVGRLYLDRSGTEWRLVDILLDQDVRGQGLGSALIRWIQQRAAEAGAAVMLRVAVDNPRAHALYRRLGFADLESADGLILPMRWHAASR
jgi:GNAT superfamily N-acetyltransferase